MRVAKRRHELTVVTFDKLLSEVCFRRKVIVDTCGRNAHSSCKIVKAETIVPTGLDEQARRV